jgi:predicted short-subunit dehydrogenase-like oxidoreductase (DUF2520 family)
MRTLNVIGGGHVGRTLGAMWRAAGVFEIEGVLARSRASAGEAVGFIGSGRPVFSIDNLPASDLYMVTTPDSAIEECARALAVSRSLEGAIVFHCSGALPSSVLSTARDAGATIASVHPIKSFADPASSVATFGGTYCGTEGDAEALAVIGPAFESLGGRLFSINPAQKTTYHTAIVFAMNYFVSLLEVGVMCYQRAGVERSMAMSIMQPIITNAAADVFRLGTTQALTGPVARGDHDIVERQLEALAAWDTELVELYCLLGKRALKLAQEQGTANPGHLDEVRASFERHMQSPAS